jgi:hypothetical protein
MNKIGRLSKVFECLGLRFLPEKVQLRIRFLRKCEGEAEETFWHFFLFELFKEWNGKSAKQKQKSKRKKSSSVEKELITNQTTRHQTDSG